MYEVFTPKSTLLKKHIHNFCILKKFTGPINYLAFPQIGTTIAFYSSSSISIGKNNVVINKTQEPSCKVVLLGKYNLPIHIEYKQYIPEISINFTPIGLNYFFNKNTKEITKEIAQLLQDKKFEKIAKRIFLQRTDIEKIDELEASLLKILIKKDLTLIQSSVSLLMDNPTHSISEIATILDVSPRTINRWFTSHVGCSPSDFKKIVRFRKAIQTKFNTPFQNLTQICFDANFYDSPHFTREFIKLTQMNPMDFFSKIIPVTKQEFPYKFL